MLATLRQRTSGGEREVQSLSGLVLTPAAARGPRGTSSAEGALGRLPAVSCPVSPGFLNSRLLSSPLLEEGEMPSDEESNQT